MGGIDPKSRKYITHREVADILGIHPDYVHDLVRAGKLPATHVPYGIANKHRIRFNEAEIRAIRDRVLADHAEMMKTKRAHFDTGTTEAKPAVPTTPGTGWHTCDKCGEAVHENDVVSHINLHNAGMQ